MAGLPTKFRTLPKELAQALGDPPLAINEKREDYDKLLEAIAVEVNPKGAIPWMLVFDVANLSWEIRRERILKQQLITSAEKQVIAKTSNAVDQVRKDLEEIFGDALAAVELTNPKPKPRRKPEKKPARSDLEPAEILFKALEDKGALIDAVDRRIASYELRRMAALRACEHYSEKLARRIDMVSTGVIEGQFTRAAE